MSNANPSHNTVAQMLKTHPTEPWTDREALARAIETITHCADICTACADACLNEDHIEQMRVCIRRDQDCADICRATATVLTRSSYPDQSVLRALLEACAVACSSCADECEQHADMHEHCRICAESCRTCATTCRQLVAQL